MRIVLSDEIEVLAGLPDEFRKSAASRSIAIDHHSSIFLSIQKVRLDHRVIGAILFWRNNGL